ncbi:hypothetical protein AB0D59_17405 [Streptomyces sp. NPDC048417]|uniref:hypothetical protein n=1 Tax=Streptomyces sp. NPDC048417 TaxID=3155387 RepID=UPI0034276BE3
MTFNWGKHAAFGAWFAISIGTREGSHKNAASTGRRIPMGRQIAFRGRLLPEHGNLAPLRTTTASGVRRGA